MRVRLVAGVADTADTAVGDNLLDRLFAAAYDLTEATPSGRRALATEAASLAFRYFTEFLPDASWQVLGVEYATGDGRVDLSWVHSRTGAVFYDEVKTSRVTHGRVPPARWVAQARRYSVAGGERHGEEFLGTRLIPLTAGHVGRLVLAEGTPMLLASTGSIAATSPDADAGRNAGWLRDESTGSPDLRLVHGRAVGGVR